MPTKLVRRTWGPAADFVPEMLSLRQAMDRLVDDSLVRWPAAAARGASALTPAVDAWEEGDTVVVELAMPGVAPDAFDVTIERDTLVVTGEVAPREEGKTWLIQERPRGRFERRFDLSVPLDVDKIEARYTDGVLRLVLPKAESVKPRKIEVHRN